MSRINQVAGFVPWRAHARKQEPGSAPLFRSEDAMWWFIRHHKPELVRAGALVWLNGSWCVHPTVFDAAYVDIVTSEARRAAMMRAYIEDDGGTEPHPSLVGACLTRNA